MQSTIEAFTSFSLAILFVIATILVIRKSRTNVNIFFASGSFLFAVGTFFAGLGYYDVSLQYLWTYATIAITLAPCGYFLAGKLIVDGDNTFRSILTYIILLIGVVSSIATLFIYSTLTEVENIIRWDPVLVLILVICSYQFYKVYQLAPELRTKLTFLLFGLVISIISLLLNVIIILLTDQNTLLRAEIPIIGQL